MHSSFDKKYWEARYQKKETTWDAGKITAPLKTYVEQLTDKNIEILIPGAGNAYEAEFLFRNGFTNVTVIDLAEEPIANFKKRVPDFPANKLLLADFFEHAHTYDLIVEQTFFCALDPALRSKYAATMHRLLQPKGKLIGVLFDRIFNTTEPPFGGSKEEYRNYFEPYFEFKTFEACYNSIAPREEKELFINLVRK
ncbi:MAG: SAM-dependent methlyltransferase [Bacteroidetes bacterium]|nr:SAM-dependent methlyltransferase [Bacteroidota bacterium]